MRTASAFFAALALGYLRHDNACSVSESVTTEYRSFAGCQSSHCTATSSAASSRRMASGRQKDSFPVDARRR